MDSISGTYALVLRSEISRKVAVGKLGTFLMPEGFYVYVGSAFGPGGVKSRVGRHLRRVKTAHWHIDHVVNKMNPVEVWYHTGTIKLECEWPAMFIHMGGECPIPGFGSSDCYCLSHLCYFKIMPNFDAFKEIAEVDIRRERV